MDRLRAGQLSFDDTTELLQAALDGQQTRRDWIIRNWPHVVEYQEVNRTLTTGTWGPDPELLTDLLTEPISDTLTAAIHADQPWLRAALCAVADHGTVALDVAAIEWLEQLATTRPEQHIAPAAPLDSPWHSPDSDVPEAAASVSAGIDL